MSGAFAAVEPTPFGNGVATISHFSHIAADCYSVEPWDLKMRHCLNPCRHTRLPRMIRQLSKFSSSSALIETRNLGSQNIMAPLTVFKNPFFRSKLFSLDVGNGVNLPGRFWPMSRWTHSSRRVIDIIE